MADLTETDQLQELREENARLKEQVTYYEQDQIVQIRRDIANLKLDTQKDVADLRQDLHREITDLKQGDIADLRQDVKVLSGKVDKILYAVIISLVGIAGLIIDSLT